MQGASAPPHPANPSLAGSGPVGGIPATPEPWLPRGRRSGAGEGREEGTRLRAGGGRSRRGPAQDEGGSRGRGGALRRGVGCCAGVPFAVRACRWRRLAGAGVRDAAQGMGGHNWPRSPLLCIIVDSSYFLFGGLGERKKKNPVWRQGEWAVESQRAAADRGGGWAAAVTCFLETPRVPGVRVWGRSAAYCALLWGVVNDLGGRMRHPAVGQGP